MIRKTIVSFVIAALFLLFNTEFAYSADTKPLQVRKQPEIQQVKPKKPVKIKLKRSSEGRYSWDLSGDDVEEVVRADKRMRKLLNVE
ncbi:MAG: hypothetical protein AB1442_12465 [Nitrospirota bacterium]